MLVTKEDNGPPTRKCFNTGLPVMVTLTLIIMFSACKSSDMQTLPVVNSLIVERYMGTWYEIARLPNTFEEGLTCVTATYKLLNNGKIRVINKGHKEDNLEKVQTAKGKAKFADKSTPGKLKVTFFWPFYGKYWIISLDEDYEYAMVGSPSRKYLWILARNKQLPEDTLKKLIERATQLGFDTSSLHFTDQNCNN